MSLAESIAKLREVQVRMEMLSVRLAKQQMGRILSKEGPHAMAAERELLAVAYPGVGPVVHLLTEDRVRDPNPETLATWSRACVLQLHADRAAEAARGTRDSGAD